MADKASYPKMPASNWWALRAQFAKTLPVALTPTYLQSLLGLTSQSAKNLLPPLRQIKLIDDDGKPTSMANDWRNDAKYNEVCQVIIAETYPQELRDLYHGPDLDREGCKNWFKHTAQLGDAGAGAIASFYALLNSGLEASRQDAPKKKEQRKDVLTKSKPVASAEARTPSQATVPKGSTIPSASGSGKETTGPVAFTAPNPTVHIDLQIHISPDASVEQIDAIFASMAKHLYWK